MMPLIPPGSRGYEKCDDCGQAVAKGKMTSHSCTEEQRRAMFERGYADAAGYFGAGSAASGAALDEIAAVDGSGPDGGGRRAEHAAKVMEV